MKLSDFRVGWRLLAREKGSWMVLAGLAVGFAACFLLFGLVHYCFTYNRHLVDSERIFLVKEKRNLLPRPDWRATAPAALEQVALGSGPGISATRADTVDVTARVRSRLVPLSLRVVDANYLDFFGLAPIQGDAAAALARPGGLVLSSAMAQALFGSHSALGAVIHIGAEALEVRAIVADLPGNTSVDTAILAGRGRYAWHQAGASENPWNQAVALYVKLPEGADPARLAATMQDAVARQRDARFSAAFRAKAAGGRITDIALTSLSDLYFDEGLLNSRSGQSYGSRSSVLGLAALACLILALAGVNYLNMVAVQCGQRQREIGMRMALGASRAQLAGQFVAESMVVALAATLAGITLAWLAAPLFATLVDRPVAGMLTPQLLAAAGAAGLLLGAAAGLYPAALALRMTASAALQGRAGADASNGLRLRRILTIFQFAAGATLTAITLAVAWQADYASSVNPGFDPAPILLVTPPGEAASPRVRAFRTQLARLDGVSGVSGMSEAVGRDQNTIISSIRRNDGSTASIEIKQVGASFFDLYGIAALHGRLFKEGRDQAGRKSIVINSLAARELGFEPAQAAVGQMLGDQGVIVGIAPELRYRTLRERPEPMLYQVNDEQPVLALRVRGEPAVVQGRVEALWARHFPDDLMRIESAADVFGENYHQERRLGKILAIASLVAIVLAAFGVYVLAAFSVERRAREIVLRKVHGASARHIARLMSKEFALVAAGGGLLGVLLAWFAIESWLASFVERAPMGLWPLALSHACVVLVGLVATARHTVRAMRMMPAQALRA